MAKATAPSPKAAATAADKTTANNKTTGNPNEEVVAGNKPLITGGVKPATVVDDPKFKEFIADYVKGYPKEKLFLITSDWQVFLSDNKAEAAEHQKGVDKSKEVLEYSV